MKLFLSVRGKGQVPTSRKQFYRPDFPVRMLIKLWGKIDVIGREDIEIECENPLMLDEVAKEIETISTEFFSEFNARIYDKTLMFELSGEASKAYRMRNSVPSFGYDVYIID